MEDEDQRFCMDCGTSLWLIEVNEKDLFREAKQDLNELEEYLQYQMAIEETEGLEEVLDEQYTRLKTIKEDLKSIEWDRRGAKYDLEMDRRRYENYKKLTLTSLIARLKGERKEKLEFYEARYRDEQANFEAVEENLSQLIVQKQKIEDDLKILQDLYRYRQKYLRFQDNIAERVLDGVEIEKVDHLQHQLDEINQEYQPLSKVYNSYRMALKKLKEAKRNFQSAGEAVVSARSTSNIDLIGGAGLITQLSTARDMEVARKKSAAAMSALSQAKSFVSSIKVVEPVIGSSNTGSILLDGLVFDSINRFKIGKSLASVKNTVSNVETQINSVENIVNNLESRYNEMSLKIIDLKNQIRQLRREYIEEHLVKQ